MGVGIPQWTPPSDPRRPKRFAGALIPLLCIGTVLSVAAGGCALAVASIDFDFDFEVGEFDPIDFDIREPLPPVAITAAQCDALRPIPLRALAAWRTQNLYPDTAEARPWPVYQREVGLSLAEFELTLRTAMPNVPRKVAVELETVANNVQFGRLVLARSTSVQQYHSDALELNWTGYFALLNADDRARRCGFDVAPSDVFQIQ